MAGRLAARAAAISRRVASGGWAPPGGSSARPGRALPRPPPPAAWSGSFGVGGSPRFQPRASIAPPVCANSELRPLAARRGSAAPRTSSASPGGSWRSSRSAPRQPGPAATGVDVATRGTRWGRRPAPGTWWRWRGRPSLAPRTRTPLPARPGLPGCEEGRGFSEDLPLLPEHPILTPQPPQFLLLTAGQALPAALVDIRLTHPVAQRLVGHPQILGDLGQGLVTGPDQAHRLGPEGRRVGRSRSRHRTPPGRSSRP